jgi:hypothetical protein
MTVSGSAPRTAHIALYDTVADWEIALLLTELRTGRFTGVPFEVVTMAESQSPVHFARATLGCLGLASGRTLQAYEDVFHRGDASAYPVLMQAAGAA